MIARAPSYEDDTPITLLSHFSVRSASLNATITCFTASVISTILPSIRLGETFAGDVGQRFPRIVESEWLNEIRQALAPKACQKQAYNLMTLMPQEDDVPL